MALYRLEVKVVSRGKQGASMVAGAAYRSQGRSTGLMRLLEAIRRR